VAQNLGAVDAVTTDLDAGVRDADLVYVATPVGIELDFIRRMAPVLKPGAVVTDAGSTKALICRGVDEIPGVRFVGGHPMAGSESAGVEAASPNLFRGAAYVVTPTEKTHPDDLALMKQIAESLGSRVIELDPDTHDRCAAAISHLPHLMAAALIYLVKEQAAETPEVLEMVAGSFKDMTRVAESSPELWRDIFLSNTASVKSAADGFIGALSRGLAEMSLGNAEGVKSWFKEAGEIRKSILQGGRDN
jgi:prephenate dehydrogenase